MSDNKYGYLGNATYKGNEKLYFIWKGMIRRCNCDTHIRHHCYINVSVSDRWMCFENFLCDVEQIDGWDKEKFLNNELQLDKDYKQMGKEYKIYSKDTCIWVSKYQNNVYQPNHCKPFRMIYPNGDEKIYFSQHQCARENNLEVSLICRCLSGERKTHKSFKFKYC